MPYGSKEFKESNISYLNKDFDQFKEALVNYSKAYFPNTYKDFNETSPGMMLMEMSAYVGDVLSFYIDQQYKEMILPLAEERRNVLNMAKMFGYKVKPIVPAYVNLTFKSIVTAVVDDEAKIDYSNAGIWDAGIQISSVANPDIKFETLEPIDFTISQSNDTTNIQSVDSTTGLVSTYNLSRTVKAVSGETETKSFTIGAPQKFLRLNLEDENVIEIISCVDSNNNNWYEVDYLAQDKVPIPTHYTHDDTRDTAYYDLEGNSYVQDVPVPYSLEYIHTSKRFVRETNLDNTTSLVFGNGILRNGTTIGDAYLDLEQAGIVVPGTPGDLNEAIDLTLGDDYSTLGETPMQTTLTVTYRKGGGSLSNVASGELVNGTNVAAYAGNQSATLESVSNNLAARGGRDEETIDEIKEKSKAFFSTQARCVTKEDYEARVKNMSSKFGNIAKIYVSRNNIAYAEDFATDITVYLDAVDTLLTNIAATPDAAATLIDSFNISAVRPSNDAISVAAEPGTINLFILAYDMNKNLVGNPHSSDDTAKNENVPVILKQNISNYVSNFRILTDNLEIQDGYIINFGVIFDVSAHKFANKMEVKVACIQKIKEYFNTDKMQFQQPIYVSQIEYELMGVEGVRSVNYVTITQDVDYNDPVNSPGFGDDASGLYKYSITDMGDIVSSENDFKYGWKYNFGPQEGYSGALVNGVILPPAPDNPAVFELKYPDRNIIGVVR